MKIGFIQFAPALGDVQATILCIDVLLPLCETADLVVLPELCNSGYNFASHEQAWETSEAIQDSIFIEFLEATCRKLNLHIVSGFNERDEGVLYNSAVLVGPGGYLGTYRKLHLFMNEKDHFKPGDAGLRVYDIGSCRIGMLVCFDWVFPEVWRILALEGADIICHPSSLVLPGLAQKAVPIHALTNGVYTITANRIGTEESLTFTGLSTIASPRGDILIQASQTGEEVGIRDVDLGLAREKMITERNDLLADRRPEEYSLLVDTTVKG